MDLQQDIFADMPFGKAAMAKLGKVPDNFRLYSAGWLGNKPRDMNVMEVKGAVFRHAKSGPRKGQLCIMEKATTRTVYVTREEMDKFDTEEEASG